MNSPAGRGLAEDNVSGALRHFEEGLATARDIPLPLLVGQLLFEEAQALDALAARGDHRGSQ